ncbi:MAG: hypothetical protein QOF35_1814 [Actinomycetota bacterium]|jgi:hypothetical protein|nr:hypothetical protein [Actinomycetota bacterium]
MAKGNAISIESGPMYSRVKVQVMGPHPGFLATVTTVQAAMRRAGVQDQDLSNFYQDATAEGQDNLLRTCLRWVDVEVG